MTRARTILLAVVMLGGCGGSTGTTAVPPSDPTEPIAVAEGASTTEDETTERGEPESAAPAAQDGVAGATLENPVKACGPGASYRLIAAWECADGSVPLGGDPAAGQRARLGSSRSHLDEPPDDPMNSHIVDIYEVPCPGGTETVHVCMYHCASGQSF